MFFSPRSPNPLLFERISSQLIPAKHVWSNTFAKEKGAGIMTDAETKRVLDEMIQRIITLFQPERIILFGSYAKGQTNSDSDLDLLVVMPVEGSRRGKANEIDLALADRLVPLDVVVVTPEQFEQQRNTPGSIIREAAHEGKTLYERAA